MQDYRTIDELPEEQKELIRKAIFPGAVLNEVEDVVAESISDDLSTIKLRDDKRLFQFGLGGSAIMYWPEGDQLTDDDVIVIYELDDEIVAYYGS